MTERCRIATKSNFDDEMFTESFLNVPPMYKDSAQLVCNELNKINPNGPDYYACVPLDYQLYSFQP